MKNLVKFLLTLGVAGFILSGCGRVVKWGSESFYQGCSLDDIAALARTDLRSVTVYDQFTTVGMFDVLWLSDHVRTIYAQLYTRRRGKSEEFYKTFLRRQLEENNHFISFYVLSPFEYPLTDVNASWVPFLKVNDQIYHPLEIKVVDLDPEYKAIFGKHYSRFKETYIVRFSSQTVDEQSIITDETSCMCMHFRSLEKETRVCWSLHSDNDKCDNCGQDCLDMHKECHEICDRCRS